jgi:predicted acetyltransferase
MPELISPTSRLRDSWLVARDEWGPGVHQDGAGLHDEDDVDTADGFAAWVARLRREADPSIPLDAGRVHATYWWITEAGSYAGAISLRHALNKFLLRIGGNIGYGIRPSARGRGLATWALRAVLPHASELGLDRVLVTCADSNLASARTIEKCGGVLDDIDESELGRTRRYWIALLAGRPAPGRAALASDF